MDWYYGFGLFCYSFFNELLIDVEGIRAYIDKYWHSSTQNKSVCRTDKGIVGHDDFITRLNTCENCHHFYGSSSRVRQETHGATEGVFHPFLSSLGIKPVPCQLSKC